MTSPSTSNSFRVLQLTDPHMFAGRDSALRDRVSWRTLSDTIEHYMAGTWQADIVYLTGDLVHDDSRDAYRNLREIIDRLHLPVYVVPGNHDVPNLIRQELSDYVYCGLAESQGWRILGIDTYAPGVASGLVGEAELDRLRAQLGDGDNRPSAVFMHHPPIDVGSEWLDAVGLADRAGFLELVERCGNVRVIVFGHAHQAFDNRDDSLRIVGTPSTVRQFKPGEREFAVDDLPPAYRRLEFHDDGGFETEVIWIDGRE